MLFDRSYLSGAGFNSHFQIFRIKLRESFNVIKEGMAVRLESKSNTGEISVIDYGPVDS